MSVREILIQITVEANDILLELISRNIKCKLIYFEEKKEHGMLLAMC